MLFGELGQVALVERPGRSQQHEVTARRQADQGEVFRQFVLDRLDRVRVGRSRLPDVPRPRPPGESLQAPDVAKGVSPNRAELGADLGRVFAGFFLPPDRKSTRLNSSHGYISYAVFCLKKKKS